MLGTEIAKENALQWIYGYFMPKPGESVYKAFERAQRECSGVFIMKAKHVEAISFDDFLQAYKPTTNLSPTRLNQ